MTCRCSGGGHPLLSIPRGLLRGGNFSRSPNARQIEYRSDLRRTRSGGTGLLVDADFLVPPIWRSLRRTGRFNHVGIVNDDAARSDQGAGRSAAQAEISHDEKDRQCVELNQIPEPSEHGSKNSAADGPENHVHRSPVDDATGNSSEGRKFIEFNGCHGITWRRVIELIARMASDSTDLQVTQPACHRLPAPESLVSPCICGDSIEGAYLETCRMPDGHCRLHDDRLVENREHFERILHPTANRRRFPFSLVQTRLDGRVCRWVRWSRARTRKLTHGDGSAHFVCRPVASAH